MESPTIDDPYETLGLTKQATAGDVKTAYRKLALKCHPDKVTDEALKKQKTDEFHKIQQAYDILADDEKRGRYDAKQRLAELKAEMLRRESGRGASRSTSFTSRPTATSYDSYTRSANYEVRSPRFTEDYTAEPRSTTRKHSDAGAYVRRTSSYHSEKAERERKTDKERSERRRARDADVRDSRDRKYYNSSQEEIDDRARFESERRARDDKVKAYERTSAAKVEEANRKNVEALRSEEYRRRASVDDGHAKKYSSLQSEARRYQSSAEQGSTPRPKLSRSESSSRHYDPHRSRARRSPEADDRGMPSFAQSKSSPDKLSAMAQERSVHRSYSTNVTSKQTDVPIPIRRTETMPANMAAPLSSMSSRRKGNDAGSTSKLRHEIPPIDSGYSSASPVSPITGQTYVQSPIGIPRSTTYHYGAAAEAAAAYQTEVRVPKEEGRSSKERDRERRKERNSRDDILSGARIVSPLVREGSYSYRAPDEERARDRDRADRREREKGRGSKEMGYGELESDFTRQNGLRARDYGQSASRDYGQPTSYDREDVNMARKFGVDDVNFGRGSRERRARNYDQYDAPSFGRSGPAQTVYA